jgi:hypothetical protein
MVVRVGVDETEENKDLLTNHWQTLIII